MEAGRSGVVFFTLVMDRTNCNDTISMLLHTAVLNLL